MIKKNGLYLSISSVTPANEGEYVCLVQEDDMEIVRAYNIKVDGKEHLFPLIHSTYTHFQNFVIVVEHFEFRHM